VLSKKNAKIIKQTAIFIFIILNCFNETIHLSIF